MSKYKQNILNDLIHQENSDLSGVHLTKDQILRLLNQAKENDNKINELKRKLQTNELGYENTRQSLDAYKEKCNLLKKMIAKDKKNNHESLTKGAKVTNNYHSQTKFLKFILMTYHNT